MAKARGIQWIYVLEYAFLGLGIGGLAMDYDAAPEQLQTVDEHYCSFHDDIQGAYRTQDVQQTTQQQRSLQFGDYSYYEFRDPIKYRDIYVGPSSIPLWGDCFEKEGATYVLKMKKVGGSACYRCFVIVQRTPNVLQAHNNAESVCYSSAAEAKRSCIDEKLVQPQEGMLLYRSEHLRYQYCPVGGRAYLTYSSSGGRLQCPYPSSDPSTINNCKFGYQLDVALRGCTFPAYDISFRCLGTWDAGRNGETFFAVYNIAAEEYRCGIFSDAQQSGAYAFAALSNDSNCVNMLSNSSNGYERFAFFRDTELMQPSNTNWNPPSGTPLCTFPDWIQGVWDTMNIDRDTISLFAGNDPSTMSTIYGRCGDVRSEKFKVVSKSHCGDDMGSTCVWFRSRSPTVFEVKIVTAPSNAFTFENTQCFEDSTYANVTWSAVTPKTKVVVDKLVTCPFWGQYATVSQYQKKGRYCYNISSDCSLPYQFRLIKYLCESDVVYETSQYHCLATWSEDDNMQYTFVNRTGDGMKGCFISETDSNGRIFVSQLNKQCERNLDFARLMAIERFGNPVMVVQESSSCSGSNSIPEVFAPGDGSHRGSTPQSTLWGNRRRNSAARKFHKPLILAMLNAVYVLLKTMRY